MQTKVVDEYIHPQTKRVYVAIKFSDSDDGSFIGLFLQRKIVNKELPGSIVGFIPISWFMNSTEDESLYLTALKMQLLVLSGDAGNHVISLSGLKADELKVVASEWLKKLGGI